MFFLSRGDVIIAKSPFDPGMNICKRVIGLEGDKVCTSGPSDLFKSNAYVSICIIFIFVICGNSSSMYFTT